MFKPILVGIGSVASGLLAIYLVRLWGIDISPAIAGGIMSGTVMFASQHAYNLGKKDGMSAAQKVEQDRADEDEES